MFDNCWAYRMHVTEHMKSKHLLIFRICQSSPLLAIVAAHLCLMLIYVAIPANLLSRWGLTSHSEVPVVDEDLPNFFRAVKLREADRLLSEDEMMRSRYGFEIREWELTDKLQNTAWPEKAIQGTPWYSVLGNLRYTEPFGYIGPHEKERDLYIKDCDEDDDNNGEQSDVVSILLNLGSIPDFVARQFSLEQDFSAGFKHLMADYKEKFKEKCGNEWTFSNP